MNLPIAFMGTNHYRIFGCREAGGNYAAGRDSFVPVSGTQFKCTYADGTNSYSLIAFGRIS